MFIRSKELDKCINKKAGSMFVSWRAKVYTKKGKDIGFPESWYSFSQFSSEMSDGWFNGAVLIRKDTSIPYSVDNCIWANKGDESGSKMSKLEYNGVTKTLLEWSNLLELNYNGVRQRYFRGKDYTPEQILFGKKHKFRVKSIEPVHSKEQAERSRISKIASTYRNNDNRKELFNDISFEVALTLIKDKSCTYCGDTNRIGLDRIDNNFGHSVNNVVPCCYECNIMRSNMFSHEEMFAIGKTVKQIKSERNGKNK